MAFKRYTLQGTPEGGRKYDDADGTTERRRGCWVNLDGGYLAEDSGAYRERVPRRGMLLCKGGEEEEEPN